MPDVFIPDLTVQPSAFADDWLLVRTRHQTVALDRRIQLTNFQLTKDGELVGGGRMSLGGNITTVTKDGTHAMLDDLLRLGVGGTAGLDLAGNTLTAHSGGVIATLADVKQSRDAIAAMLAALRAELATDEARIGALEGHETTIQNHLDAIDAQLAGIGSTPSTTPGVDPATQALLVRIQGLITTNAATEAALQTALDALRAKLATDSTDTDSEVAALRAEIARLKAEGVLHDQHEADLQTLINQLQARVNGLNIPVLQKAPNVTDPALLALLGTFARNSDLLADGSTDADLKAATTRLVTALAGAVTVSDAIDMVVEIQSALNSLSLQTNYRTQSNNLISSGETILARLNPLALKPETHLVDEDLRKEIENLINYVLGMDAAAAGLASQVANLQSSLASGNLTQIKADLLALRTASSTLATKESQLETLVNQINTILTKEVGVLKIIDLPSGQVDVQASARSLWITTQDTTASPTNFARLDQDALHIRSGAGRTILDHRKLEIRDPSGTVTLMVMDPTKDGELSSSGDLYLTFHHPTSTHTDPTTHSSTDLYRMKTSEIWDFMHTPHHYDMPVSTSNPSMGDSDKVLSWVEGTRHVGNIWTQKHSGYEALHLRSVTTGRTNSEIVLEALHASGGTGVIRMLAEDVVANGHVTVGTLTASNIYDHTQSNARFAPKAHTHPYLTQSAGDARYARTHSHSAYLTTTTGDRRYWTHSAADGRYYQKSASDARYARLNHPIRAFSTGVRYATNDLVNYSYRLFAAKRNNGPGAWNASNWVEISPQRDAYTKSESNSRYALKSHSHSYLTQSAADSRYAARTHSHSYLTQAAADARYARTHSHPYLTQSAGDVRYYTRNETNNLFVSKSFLPGSYYSKTEANGRFMTQAQGDIRYARVPSQWYRISVAPGWSSSPSYQAQGRLQIGFVVLEGALTIKTLGRVRDE